MMKLFRPMLLALGLTLAPLAVQAQSPAAVPAGQVPVQAAPKETAAPGPAAGSVAETAPGAPAPTEGKAAAPAAAGDGSLPGYTPMAPVQGTGMPQDREIGFQDQYSPTGTYAKWINNSVLEPIIIVITIFVLLLMFWVVFRFRRSANPVPSKTSHNTVIEVIWTAVPVLILLAIAVPSIDLLAKQYKSAPKNAVTIKATGYQWYWGYTYPDNGGFEVISNMLPEGKDAEPGKRFRTMKDGPRLLAVDNRMVVPAGVPLRIQTTGSDVIHSFAVPALWFKLDAVPGRLNEKATIVMKPGVYYGQCSELCGARHGFMPIVVEALPPAKFAAWVKAQGGTMPGEAKLAANVSASPTAPAAQGVLPGATTDASAAAKAQANTAVSAPVPAPASAN